jgi:hypothetical protein
MTARRYEDLPLRKVVGNRIEGKNRKLALECGHSKRIGRGIPIPKKSHCTECPVG